MATVDPVPGRRKPRKSSAPKRGKPPRKRRTPAAKKKSSREAEGSSVGRLERTRRLLLAALRVWELKRRVRD
jgi:hypothetical protein